MISPIVWIGFIVLVFIMMALDLGVFNRRDHIPSAKEALRNTFVWITIAVLFGGFIFYAYEYKWMGLGTDAYEPLDGATATLKYFTGYLLEEALSVDNLFVMALIFTRFRIPKKYQHRILFWGILGVLVFRGILIGVGITLIHHFMWLFYFFGALLLYSAWKMLRHDDDLVNEDDFDKNRIVRFLRRFYPVTSQHQNGNFFAVTDAGKRAMTPMFVALIIIELTDVMFAFDSVPAVFSITTDPFIVFSSNVFAILGLRSLYFVLSDIIDRFERLKLSLIAILFFIGVKMILIPMHIHLPEWLSLGVIALFLLLGVFASLYDQRGVETNASDKKKVVKEPAEIE